MSLTSHLDDPNSPVREFMAARFPNLRAVRFADSELKLGSEMAFPALDIVVEPSWPGGSLSGLAGAAFDYNLRVLYERAADRRTLSPVPGWLSAAAYGAGQVRLTDAWGEVLAGVESTLNDKGAPDALPDSDAVARLCVVIALFDQVCRMSPGTPSFEQHPLVVADRRASLTDVLGMADDRVPRDVSALVALYAETQPELAPTRVQEVRCGPTFARSADLGGADADLILDGRLIDLKATRKRSLDRPTVWQLLGYLLADTDDQFKITSVGVYFARFGHLWEFDTAQFLRRLAGEDVDLAAARADFALACGAGRPGGHKDSARRAVAPPRAVVLTPSRAAAGMRFPASGRVDRLIEFLPATSGKAWHTPDRDPLYPHPTLAGRVGARCRADLVLDESVEPITPPLGDLVLNLDSRLCKHCLVYLDRVWEPARGVAGTPPYYRPVAGHGKWHTTAASTGYHYLGAADAPACGAPVALDLDSEPTHPVGDIFEQGRDGRLCRRCLAIPPQ